MLRSCRASRPDAGVLLATATITCRIAVDGVSPAAKAPAAPTEQILVVPDVRGQAYVFARAPGGRRFAWLVQGTVGGYAANTAPTSPGARHPRRRHRRSHDVLRLQRKPRLRGGGTPENAAPFTGTPVRLAGAPKRIAPRRRLPAEAGPAPAEAEGAAQAEGTARDQAQARAEGESLREDPERAPRPAEFAVPAARPTSRSTRSAPARARRLDPGSRHTVGRPTPTCAPTLPARLDRHRRAVRLVAREEALRLLLDADRRAQRLWGVGAKNELVTRRALRFVASRTR